jgi:hypothetical protein
MEASAGHLNDFHVFPRVRNWPGTADQGRALDCITIRAKNPARMTTVSAKQSFRQSSTAAVVLIAEHGNRRTADSLLARVTLD